MKARKELIVVGDRVLISPEDPQQKTDTGLYLPDTVKDREKVQGGYVVKIGPGYPVPDPSAAADEPWAQKKADKAYFPLQAQENDYVIFLKNAAVEVKHEGHTYFVVPHHAILLILRDVLSN